MSILRVLERFVNDWSEIYVAGELLWEGPKDVYDYQLVTAFLNRIAELQSTTIKRRRIMIEYEGDNPEEMPVHRLTNENYFSDWNNAEDMEN